MTHDDYLARLDRFTDSSEDANEVLLHADSCAICRKERRTAERALAHLNPEARSIAEEVARFVATAAVVLIVVFGMRRLSAKPEGPRIAEPPARYRVVGNPSGVVAYTPSGIVIGLASNSAEKGVTR